MRERIARRGRFSGWVMSQSKVFKKSRLPTQITPALRHICHSNDTFSDTVFERLSLGNSSIRMPLGSRALT
jgi:hypothetical protein